MLDEKLKYSAIGMVAGLLSGLMGVGGGVIMVPLMVTLLPFTQHQAHGTSLSVVMFTSVVSALAYSWQGSIDLLLALELAVGGVIGARVGALWTKRIPGPQLRRIFGGFLTLAGLRMVLPSPPAADWLANLGPGTVAVDVGLGLIVGILSGMLGVGGGIVMVPLLVLLLGIEQHLAQGVSLAYIIPTASMGAYTHYRQGNVVRVAVPWMAMASLLMAVLGSALAHSIGSIALRQVFGIFLSLIGLQMGLTGPKMGSKGHRYGGDR